MPRTTRDLAPDMKSVASISYRRSTDGTAIVATNTYEEHNGRPLLLNKETLQTMLRELDPQPAGLWTRVTPSAS